MKKQLILILIIVINTVVLQAQQIIRREYFFDVDPGIGKAIGQNISPVDSLNDDISFNVSGLSLGFHKIYTRYQANDGNWSHAEDRSFYIYDTARPTITTSPSLLKGEYFFGNDPGIGNGVAFTVAKGDSINENINVVFPDTLKLGLVTFSIRVMDSLGVWGIAESRTIKVCSTYGPVAKFELVKDNNQVSLLNRSENAALYKWLLNGSTLTTTNVYQKLEGGNYKATLIAINSCGEDTSTKSFTIEALKKISPAIGGNTGRVIIRIEGFGFIQGTTFTLEKGLKKLVVDTVQVVNKELIISGLNLINAEKGFYKLKVIIPGLPPLEKDSAFEVVDGAPALTTVDIIAPPIIRSGRATIVKVKITNQSNNDVYGVPVFIDGIPIGSTIKILNDTIHLEGIPDDPGVTYKTFLFNDTVSKQILIPVVLPGLSPEETKEIVLEITASSSFKVNANTYSPLLKYTPASSPGYTLRTASDDLSASACKGCQSDVMQDIAYNIVAASADIIIQTAFASTPIGKWRECILSGTDLAYSIYNLASKKYLYTTATVNKVAAIFSMTDILGGAFKTGVDCAKAAGASTPVGFVGNLVYDAYKTYDRINKLAITPIYNPSVCAAECLKAKTARSVDVDVRASYDPNIKTGPGTINGGYINKDKELTYQILFENEPTATLPAQTVFIYDTLDINKFDFKTFNFRSASVGLKNALFIGNNYEAISNIDLRPEVNFIARVNGKIDTATGIIQWQFQTVDITTNQETTDPLAGFLPPNIQNSIGEGSVTYTIKQKESLSTGDAISNKASIVFDANTPIITDPWNNTFDLIPPDSKVQLLPETISSEKIEVKWGGTDNLSGVNRYDVYVSKNNEPYAAWLLGTSALKDTFIAASGNSYKFYSIATDNAGNIEFNKSIGEAATSVSNSTLPVKFIYFQAVPFKDKVSLVWQTASEIKFKEFQIQRSADGRNFEAIAILPGSGNSTTVNNYHHNDYSVIKQFAGENVYYRILQIDQDGKTTFTDIKTVRIPRANEDLYLSFNPVRNEAVVNYLATENETAVIRVIDQTGRLVLSKEYSIRIGANQLSIKTETLAKGIYELQLFTSKRQQHIRIMKE